MSSNINGLPLDSPELFPIYERAASRGVPMWVHPTTPITLDIIGTKSNHDILFGWPMDTSIALLKLVTSGVLESRYQVQDSATAVVSWPKASRV